MKKSLLWDRNDPIIPSLLEVDVYKLTMLFFIWRFYPNLQVKFGFTNRTKNIRLADHISESELRDQLRHVETLRMEDAFIAYLRSWGIFSESFLVWLKGISLPALSICKNEEGGTYEIEASGNWAQVTLWETIVLAVVNELYFRDKVRDSGMSEQYFFNEGDRRLTTKIELLRKYPGIKFAQFGKRRRASGLWERYITKRLLEEVPGNIVGVSNVALAHELGVEAVGTNAHELQMALYALGRHVSDVEARKASYTVLEKWQMLYGNRLLIALPDTFGSDVFLKNMSPEQAFDWKGFRQDSGDPIVFGEKIIAFYRFHGIDPREKLVIFSDGLTIETMIYLYEYFDSKIKVSVQVSHGWGSNLTNDLGIPALSIVMKLIEAAGRPAVKLSDNLAKATGDAAEIVEAKRIFGYTNTFTEVCTY